MTDKEKDELLLTQVALMFQTAALQQMGKLKNPITDAVDRDLDQARMSIDILDVLHRRMKGNLSEQEERMLATVLRELRLNYVDEASKRPPQQTPQPGGEGRGSPAGPSSDAAPGAQ
jgi:hypothetical protein